MKRHFEDGTYHYPLQNYKKINHIHVQKHSRLKLDSQNSLQGMQHEDSNSDFILSILQSLFLLFEPLIGIHVL